MLSNQTLEIRLMRRTIAVCSFFAVILMVASASWIAAPVASAADKAWRPDRPVRFVVAGSPGGAFSTVALILAPKFHEALGQPWVLDNRGGAGGSVAGQIVASANPNGYTVLMTNGLMLTVRPQLYKETPYLKNLVAIGTQKTNAVNDMIRSETKMWAKVIKDANIKVE